MTDTIDQTQTNDADTYGDELPPGTELCYGQYVIDRYLNSGGFGVTYMARDSLGRQVVIKECFPNAMCYRSGEHVRIRSRSYLSDYERVVELFEKEARALAHLQHANVVGVHQIFKDNGTAYMALDFVDGMDLLDIVEEHPEVLTPKRVKSLLSTLLQALSYVHSNGILHRDISPDNILLDHSGIPVLIDFGAARENASRASRILSRVHTVKDGYSPQEFYFAGSSQSPSSDLYALAASFYHIIVGTPPPNSNERLAAVAENRPDPFQPLGGRFPQYEDYFLAAIDRCLSLFSKDRLESAEVWLDAIDNERTSHDATSKEVAAADVEIAIAEMVAKHQIAPSAPKPKQKPKDGAKARSRQTRQVAELKAVAENEYWQNLREDLAECYGEPSAPQHTNKTDTLILNDPIVEEGHETRSTRRTQPGRRWGLLSLFSVFRRKHRSDNSAHHEIA